MTDENRQVESISTSLRFIQFSDMHVGMAELQERWPRSDYVLSSDLDRLIKRTGGCDLVVFSGDLAFSGVAEQYDEFVTKYLRIASRLRELGAEPKLIVVPGNHDLARPDPMDPPAYALSQYWRDNAIRDTFWADDSRYRDFVTQVFDSFTAFQSQLVGDGLHVKPVRRGQFPGDASYSIEVNGGRAGIVALNSAWLQMGAGDYEGELHVDVKQLLAVTDNLPDDWVAHHDINFLVTHHPHSWLHPTSVEEWNNDINPPGRFDLHLFGHMHEPATVSVSVGGSMARRSVQAPSLFGLETFGSGEKHRIQGYSGSLLTADGVGRKLTCWPRLLVRQGDGTWKFAPDTSQNIEEETASFSLTYEVQRQLAGGSTLNGTSVPAKQRRRRRKLNMSDATVSLAEAFDLDQIRVQLPDPKGHTNVRRFEQQSALASLREGRFAWIVADWGMGELGFVSAIGRQLGVNPENFFRFDLSGQATQQEFLDSVRVRLGADFHDICSAVSNTGANIVYLDDVDLPMDSSEPASPFESDVQSLGTLISDFSPESFVVVRSRRRPRSIPNPTEIKPLDEVDVAVYVREAEGGNERYAKPDAVALLYRHTDGVPTRLDAALRDLEIISVNDLIEGNPDIVSTGTTLSDAPRSLVVTIAELSTSEERSEKRAYDLLLALAAFPQGERLTRLKRFLGTHPFYPAHARSLLERSLIDTVVLTGINDPEQDDDAKALVVPRIVREYIRETLDESTAASLDRKALELYFGSEWTTGEIAKSPTGKRIGGPLAEPYEIGNASTLILRRMRHAIEEGSEVPLDSALRLAVSFVAILMQGDHYRSASTFCENLFHIVEGVEALVGRLEVLNYQYAMSLRMSGRALEGRATLEAINLAALSKSQKQGAELELALCCEKLEDDHAAAAAAKRTIAIDKTSNAALQAEAIIAEQIEDDKQRCDQIKDLLSRAKKNDAKVLVGNLLITLAGEEGDVGSEAEAYLREVVASSNYRSDFYNGARAVVTLANSISDPISLSDDERDKLLKAYHFLYNERLFNLFNRCHQALWRLFEAVGDTPNLLNLFRHSSFIWRLSNAQKKEIEYLAKLTKMAHNLFQRDVRQVGRDGAYFVVRVSVVLGQDVLAAASKANDDEPGVRK
jgi:predicted MPP superfamily phosphohydrolase